MHETSLEQSLEVALAKLGMNLAERLDKDYFRSQADIDDLENPPYESAIEVMDDIFYKGNVRDTSFFQEMLDGSVPLCIRLSKIKQGFGVQYLMNEGGEDILVHFNKKFTGENRFITEYYNPMSTPISVLFLLSTNVFGKPGFITEDDDILKDYQEYKEMIGYGSKKDFEEYKRWYKTTSEKFRIGVKADELATIVYDFLQERLK